MDQLLPTLLEQRRVRQQRAFYIIPFRTEPAHVTSENDEGDRGENEQDR
jgi:hypothetical protein